MTYRVALCETRNGGRMALQTIIVHPDLKLVGVVVHIKVDAGEQCAISDR